MPGWSPPECPHTGGVGLQGADTGRALCEGGERPSQWLGQEEGGAGERDHGLHVRCGAEAAVGGRAKLSEPVRPEELGSVTVSPGCYVCPAHLPPGLHGNEDLLGRRNGDSSTGGSGTEQGTLGGMGLWQGARGLGPAVCALSHQCQLPSPARNPCRVQELPLPWVVTQSLSPQRPSGLSGWGVSVLRGSLEGPAPAQ